VDRPLFLDQARIVPTTVRRESKARPGQMVVPGWGLSYLHDWFDWRIDYQ
jgi:hypothetical protein